MKQAIWSEKNNGVPSQILPIQPKALLIQLF